jgi:parallel beta-helix repeat protein
VTVRGAGRESVHDGSGTGTVLTVRSDRVAITSLSITGVGEVGNRSPSAGNTSRWEDRIMRVYGRSDAGVCFADADESLLADVRIDTPATGVLLRYSDRTVVDNVTVRGTETTAEGSMGVLPMYSRVVVEDTTVRGGRDGIYTHRADGSVLRDNDAAGMRYGIHEMYTSGLLLRNNTLRQTRTGIILMTRPTDNLLVGNLASNNTVGIVAIGDTSYLSRNVVVDNERGIDLATTRSLVTGNTVVRNAVGVSAGTVIPSNHVTGNDIVANDVPVKATAGPVRVWTVDGTGNYWGPTAGGDRNGDGAIDRSFRPTDRIDVTASSATGGPSLVRSPAMGLLERVAGSVPGLRGGGVIDTAPRTDPTRPELLAEVRNGTDD